MNQMYQSFVCITCHLLQKDSVRITPKSITTPTFQRVASSAFAIEIRNCQIGHLQSIYHIFHIYSQYHHFISPPPNKIQPSPSVTKSEYLMTSSCSGLLPCHPMSVKEPVHHGGVFFDLFLRNHDAQWAFTHDRLMIILLVEL